jgi:hypothetical protein
MRFRILTISAAVLIVLPAFAQTESAKAKPKSGSVPRTADGHPDFEGVWTNATVTPMQRRSEWANKATLTVEEAAKWEKNQTDDLKAEDGQSDGPLIAAAGSSGTGGYNALFIDRGSQMARIDGVIHSSLIVDPPDGKMPPLTDQAKKRSAEIMRRFVGNYDSIKQRPYSERCLIGFGSTSGPPMMPVLYNNNYTIVETRDKVMIAVEMVHDVRIIRMNGTHPPPDVTAWLGDSIGHWDGDTLVVDTTNIRGDNAYMGMASSSMHVVERLKFLDKETILYRATVEDPQTYTKSWTVEFPFRSTPGPMYEYACHEGNYAMPDILGGARRLESEAGKK